MILRSLSAATVLAALLIPAAVPTALQAQRIDSPYRFVETSHGFRAFGGYVFTQRGTLGAGPASGPTIGVGYNVRVSGPFEFDTQLSFLPTTRTVFDTIPADTAALRADPRAGLERLGTADLSLLILDTSLRFDLTGPRTFYRLQPYAVIGAGGVFRVASDDAVEEELDEQTDMLVRFRNGFTGHVGAGVEWHASDRFTFRLDARDILWRVHLPDGFIDQGRLIDPSEWVQNAHLSLGLVYRL